MLYQDYYREVSAVLERVAATQSAQVEQAAALVAKAVRQGGLVYVFGCGHSHLVGEDLFFRAGGFAPVSAILDSALMLHDGAVKSSVLERLPNLAQPLFERHGITSKDVLLVASTSGINAVPVEMAQCGQDNGVPVVAIVSSAYFADEARHPSGKKLYECADVVLDNCVCHGDASVTVGDTQLKTGPVSTLSSCMLAQAIMAQAAEYLWQQGETPPLYISGNLPGGAQKNEALIAAYRGRIKHL